MPKHVTNPTKIVGEELTKEELSEAIQESSELRKEFFKRWLQKLGERE